MNDVNIIGFLAGCLAGGIAILLAWHCNKRFPLDESRFRLELKDEKEKT